MADVNVILLVNQIMNILLDRYFETIFKWLRLMWQFCFNYFLEVAIF